MQGFVRYIPRKIKKSLNGYFRRPVIEAMEALPGSGLVTLIDVGAAGDIEHRWQPYKKFVNYVGFEPDERSRVKLENNQNAELKSFKILPYALWSEKGKIDINFCKSPQVSSVFVPNTALLTRYPNPGRFDVISRERVDVIALDDLGIANADFLKLDIQGAELEALCGATRTLRSILGVEIEVEFVPMYSGQPLFGDISAFMSKQDFEFIDFISLNRWERARFTGYGNCIFGDALFLRSPEALDYRETGPERTGAYLSILLIYRRMDLVRAVMKRIPREWDEQFAAFHQALRKVEKHDAFLRRVQHLADRVNGMFSADYRVHALY